MTPILVATRNRGKLVELRVLFGERGFDVVDLSDLGIAETADEDALETEETFEGNAVAKARHFHRLSALPTVADDSGLVVAALGGAPGVRSKRYAGARGDARTIDAANNALLQRALASASDRRAAFVCAAAYVDASRERVARGEVEGRITKAPAGGHGFGYDPYFFSDELGKTFAEADVGEKGLVSHRARAFGALLAALTLLPGAARMPSTDGA